MAKRPTAKQVLGTVRGTRSIGDAGVVGTRDALVAGLSTRNIADAPEVGTQQKTGRLAEGAFGPDWWRGSASLSGGAWTPGDGSQLHLGTQLPRKSAGSAARTSTPGTTASGSTPDLPAPGLHPRRTIRVGAGGTVLSPTHPLRDQPAPQTGGVQLQPVRLRLPARTGMRLGVNRAHVDADGSVAGGLESPQRYGTIDAIFGSLQAGAAGSPHVGATFVRQVGASCDLFFAPNADGTPFQLPLEAGLDAVIADRKEKVRAVLEHARDYGVAVVLTFWTLGGGGPTSDFDDPIPDVAQQFARPVGMDWTLHEAARAAGSPPTVTDLLDPSKTYVYGDPTTGSDSDQPGGPEWDAASYNTRDYYKLTYTQIVAYKMGRMLTELAAELSVTDAATFDGALDGIELFNEVNSANMLVGDEPTAGELWARAMVRAVQGFCKAYADAGAGTPLLWWSSLGSVQDEQELDVVLAFQQSLVTNVQTSLSSAELLSLRNQDNHWYRFLDAQSLAPVLTMVDVIEDLRAALEGVSTISLCETGATISAPGAVYPAWVSGTGDTSATALQFQTAEVVRRFAVACCAVTRAGWHSHMGATSASDDYSGTGLRMDAGTTRGATDTISDAQDAHFRLSAWTYQRWQTLFGGQRGRVVHPTRPGLGYGQWDPSDPDDMLTVVLLAGTDSLPYAYVVFVDSAFAPALTNPTEALTFDVFVGAGTTVQVVSLLPTTSTQGAGSGPGTFPTDSATWVDGAATTWTDLDTALTMTLTAPFIPFAWFASEPLDFGSQARRRSSRFPRPP